MLLFDMDGTLTESTQKIQDNMINCLKRLKNKGYSLGILSGGTYTKLNQQIGKENLSLFEYIFAENGIVGYKNNILIHQNNLKNITSEKNVQKIINTILLWIINEKLPFKRGNFINFRRGMLYVTPIGGDCSYEERQKFILFDKVNKNRLKLIKHLYNKIGNLGFVFSLGGSIGISVHPIGWDKTYIFNYIDNDNIVYFGDRYSPDGNDYSMIHHNKVTGYSVDSPEHTISILSEKYT